MRIVTFNNLGTGHLVKETASRKGFRMQTLCGRNYPGVLGQLKITEPQGNHPSSRSGARLSGPHLHLCGRCEAVLES